MDSYSTHMFTNAVKSEQQKQGVRERYEHTYRNRFTGPVDDDVRAFIESRTHFYLATVSETGWPYVQYRGGPVGFLKFVEDETIGFADYTGNKQMISTGNVAGDDRVSLILMDYPRQARLKLIGHMTMQAVEDNPELAELLKTDGPEPVERVATIRLISLDWNCPKYIEPRYTQDEVSRMVAPHLAKRDQTIEMLKTRLVELGEDVSDLFER